jgi:NAD(P)-dependent dehydrogenase (short-subunit alcohol dehydrogenase family)
MGKQEKYTLITGASSGVGRAVAQKLALNHNLILHGRNLGKLQQTLALCNNRDRHLLWSYDLSLTDALLAAGEKFLYEHSARVDCFVHSAGFSMVMAMRLMTSSMLEGMMRVNFSSAALISALLLKKKINGDSLKHVVFISSIASQFGARGLNVYSASKGALDSLMKSLAVELAPTVRVNSVLPGGLSENSAQNSPQNLELLMKLADRVPLGPGAGENIADVVDFLLSEKSRWITGQQIVVDGGFTVDATL